MSPAKKGKRDYLYKQLSDRLRKKILEGVYKPEERLPSMDDLAESHGMNRITVKRALSELRAENLIYSIPAQGTYVASQKAHTLKTDTQRKIIGLVISGIHSHELGPYHVDLITGLQEGIAEHEWYLMLISLQDTSEDRKFEHVMQIDLDAAVYVGNFSHTLIRRLVRSGPPAVSIDQPLRSLKCDVVKVDNFGGAYEMVSHLIENGHHQMTCVEGPDIEINAERHEGALAAWKEHHLPLSQLSWIRGDFTRESGIQAAKQLLSRKTLPSAVFCFNDEMAAGLLQGLIGSGKIRVPEDISVAGFDDISWSQATTPPFTTIQVQRFVMGHLAIQRLHAALNDSEHTPTCTTVSTKLIQRESVRKLAGSENKKTLKP